MEKIKICVFGSSITEGHHDKEMGGWVERLKRDQQAPNKNLRIFNLGISAESSFDILKRLKKEAKVRQAGVIIFAGGTNDSRYLKGDKSKVYTSLPRFKKNLAKVYKIIKGLEAQPVFVGLSFIDDAKTQPVLWNTNHSFANELIKQYDQTMKNFCQENDIPFVETYSLFGLKDLSDDGLHPNSQGHEKIFRAVKQKLQTLKIIPAL